MKKMLGFLLIQFVVLVAADREGNAIRARMFAAQERLKREKKMQGKPGKKETQTTESREQESQHYCYVNGAYASKELRAVLQRYQ